MELTLAGAAIAVVTVVLAFVLYSHWLEQHGDNHF